MNNIEQMKSLIAQLELLGQAEVTEQIEALKAKVAELEAKAIAEEQATIEQVKKEVQVVEGVAVDGFFVKYRTELIVIALFVISHVVGKFGY
jgi:hypothetical protein